MRPSQKFPGLIVLIFYALIACGAYRTPVDLLPQFPRYLLFYTCVAVAITWATTFLIAPTPAGGPAVCRRGCAPGLAPLALGIWRACLSGRCPVRPPLRSSVADRCSPVTPTSPPLRARTLAGLLARMALANGLRATAGVLADILDLTLEKLNEEGKLAAASGTGDSGALNIDSGLYPRVISIHMASYNSGKRITVRWRGKSSGEEEDVIPGLLRQGGCYSARVHEIVPCQRIRRPLSSTSHPLPYRMLPSPPLSSHQHPRACSLQAAREHSSSARLELDLYRPTHVLAFRPFWKASLLARSLLSAVTVMLYPVQARGGLVFLGAWSGPTCLAAWHAVVVACRLHSQAMGLCTLPQ